MIEDRTGKQEEVVEKFAAIGLAVGNEEYGLPLVSVREITTVPHITRVPKAPSYIMGVINLRGNIVPVIDIASRFEIGTTTLTSKSRLAVVEEKGEVAGLLAQEVSKVTRISRSDLQPPPPLVAGIAAEYLDGVVRLPDRFLIFLNLTKTLAEDAIEQRSHAAE